MLNKIFTISTIGIFLYLVSENQKEPDGNKDIKRIIGELDGKLASVKICAGKPPP